MKKQQKISGFTLIELSIAIAFMSILLLSVSLVISSTVSSYRKGISMKLVNSSGRDLIDEFTSAISAAPSVSYTALCSTYYNSSALASSGNYAACVGDNAYNLFYQQWYAEISSDRGETFDMVPVYGAFCTGKYSFLWNTGYTFGDDTYLAKDTSGAPTTNLPYMSLSYYRNGVDEDYVSDASTHFRLLKIADPNHAVCAATISSEYNPASGFIVPAGATRINLSIKFFPGSSSILYPLTEEPTELLSYSSTSLALYDFAIYPPTQDYNTKRLFYSASMVLATMNGGVNIAGTGDRCEPPSGFLSNFSYCAVNKFNFAIRATGS